MTDKGENKIMYDEDGQRLYLVGQAAKILGMKRQSLHYHIQKENIKAELVGGMFYQIRERDLLAFMEHRSHK